MPENHEIPLLVIACANSPQTGRGLDNLVRERRKISSFLNPSQANKLCEVQEEGETSIQELFRIINQNHNKTRIHLIHFAGHADDQNLAMISDNGEVQKLDTEALADFLQDMPCLKLVFLNGCMTKAFKDRLLTDCTPLLIATHRPVPDRLALDFSQAFYDAFALNYMSVQAAFAAAKMAVDAADYSSDWAAFRGSFDFSEDEELPENTFLWELFKRPGEEESANWKLLDTKEKSLDELEKSLKAKEEELRKNSKTEAEVIEDLRKMHQDNPAVLAALDTPAVASAMALPYMSAGGPQVETLKTEIATLQKQISGSRLRYTENILRRNLVHFNFQPQRSYPGVKFSDRVKMVYIRGAKGDGQRLLLTIMQRLAGLYSEIKPTSHIEFAHNEHALDPVPSPLNIWPLTAAALGLGAVDQPSAVCAHIAEAMQTQHVVIRWENFHECLSRDRSRIIQAFWEGLCEHLHLPQNDKKLVVFLVENAVSREEIHPEPVKGIQLKPQAETSMEPLLLLPPIDLLKKNHLEEWIQHLRLDESFAQTYLTDIDKSAGDNGKSYLNEWVEKPVEIVLEKIFKTFAQSPVPWS
ncbi:MAG: CHAT domain-containing protein [Bacteroidia bacterium]|nr:CHAT domain-containing protein [Bacteroidia bacterium]